MVLTPDLWAAWVRSLTQTSEPGSGNTVAIPLPYRLVAAAILVSGVPAPTVAGRWSSRRPSRIPVLWLNGLAMLAGIVALHRGFPERLHGQLDWLIGPFRGRSAGPLAPPDELTRAPAA